MIESILSLSILLQLGAAILALRLIRVTGTLWAWLIIAAAILMMVVRRTISLITHLSNPDAVTLSLESEFVALLTSALLLVGISYFSPILRSLRRESENVYEQLLNAPEETYAVMFTSTGEILSINRQAGEFFHEQTHPSSLKKLLETVFSEPFEELVNSCQRTGEGTQSEVALGDRWLSASLQPIASRAGNFDKFALLMRDITAIKESHEAEIQHELMLLQADKLASLGMLVSGVAHEINNPNQYILSHLGSIEKMVTAGFPILDSYHREFGDFKLGGLPYDLARAELPHLIKEIRQGAERIQRIVSELRSFAVKSGPIEFTEVDLSDVVDSALILLKSTINKSTDCFDLQIARHLPPVLGSFQQLEQVVINLVSNACQALLDSNDSIRLSVFNEVEGKVILRVEDSGCGIDDENLEKITDPFYTTKRDKGGTGLGLAVTKRIVEEHGGTLEFRSRPLAGTTVIVSFPGLTEQRRHRNDQQ